MDEQTPTIETAVPETEEAKPAVQDTPEFKEAVQSAVLAMVPTLLGEIQAARGGAPENSEKATDDKAFAERLAMAISELTDQGTGRKRVAPEIIESRAKARTRMTTLIIQARANGIVPSYQLRNKVYLDEVLVDPVWVDANRQAQPTVIDWPGVPNEAMVPTNDAAKGIYEAFAESIGSVAPEHRLPEDKLGVTPNGLVVRNGAVQARREVGTILDGGVREGEGLRLHHKAEGPTKHKEIRVLGSVAQPARVGVV